VPVISESRDLKFWRETAGTAGQKIKNARVDTEAENKFHLYDQEGVRKVTSRKSIVQLQSIISFENEGPFQDFYF
jgi:hypothetical protein